MAKSVFTSLLAPHTKVTEEQLATEEGILALGENLRALNRRRFLSTLAAAGAIAAAGGGVAGRAAQAQAAAGPSVVDVLNFALNFEYLEANFYIAGANDATTTPPLTSAQTGTAGNITNLPMVTLTGNQQNVAAALAMDESNHITVLRSAISQLGGTAINEPDIDFSAGGTVPPITTNVAFFAAARQFTALGNSAYAGAAADLISQPAILQTAAQILGAEAQHLGVVNYLCAMLGILPGPTADKQIDAQDVPPNGTAAIFTVTPIAVTQANPAPAVGIARTPQQVLGVAYGVSTPTTVTPTAGIAKGGFFPNGVMGTIVST